MKMTFEKLANNFNLYYEYRADVYRVQAIAKDGQYLK